MECPCTTRTRRIISGFTTKVHDTCGAGDTLPMASECFVAAASLVGDITQNITKSDPTVPAGCYVISHAGGTEAHFNTDATSKATCGTSGTGPVRSLGSAASSSGDFHMQLELDGKANNATITLRGPAGVWFGIGFNAANMADLPYTIVVDGAGKVTEHKLGNHMPGTVIAPSVEVLSDSVGPAPQAAPSKMNHLGSKLQKDIGADNWQSCRDACDGVAACGALTFFPIRFSTPYNLQDGTCRLRRWLVPPGVPRAEVPGFTPKGWTDGMLSGEKEMGTNGVEQVRTVVMRRALKGATADHYTFDPAVPSIPFIEAVGTTSTFQYHGKSRGGGAIMMVEAGAPVCVCRGKTQGGSINGIPWSNNCEAYPATTILRDHNPSCSIETYGGGMICCHHGIFLLDAEQEIPAPTFRFWMKYRFYYEDPQNATATNTVASLYPGLDYQNAFFMFRETEVAHGEYDVPKCAAGTPPEECVHTVVGHFQVKDAMHKCTGRADVWCSPVNVPNKTYPQSDHVAFVHISPHCHGPACISMQMINADTNETICYTEPHYGKTDRAVDEAGYAAGIPPCIWGTAEEGLPPPPVVSLDTNITVIKKANSTAKHYGVMGHWQMRAIWAAPPKTA